MASDDIYGTHSEMCRTIGRIVLLFLLFVFLVLYFFPGISFADELRDNLQAWHSKAFLCEGAFPSKFNASYPEGCDDGDMTLFNGLLCLSGEMVGCSAVGASQGQDGRWWRSPRKVNKERSATEDVSFSPDQALGVISYVLARRDAADKFSSWLDWISAHKGRLSVDQLNEIFKKQIQGLHISDAVAQQIISQIANSLPERFTYCTDDIDGRCTLRPADCALLFSVSQYLGRSRDICGHYLFFDDLNDTINQLNQQPLAELTNFKIELPDIFALAGVYINKEDFPLHLAGVQVFIRKIMSPGNVLISEAEKGVMSREPKNPFFAFLGEDRNSALELLLQECPDGRTTDRSQWAWERPDSEKAWEHRMYWDCIFVGNLLK